ncbi:MAG: L-ribulose-5-phosphate 3-epimerase [Clostridiales bacterium]|jgi:L-ribulose-5-phosphate 3-epimerase|nr:L-ribulose-5-phosphate 3-epimerase [Clostridiales bacterium]
MKDIRLGLYEKAMPGFLSWEQKLKCAKAAGYDFVEMSVDETDEKLSRLDMSATERLEVLTLMSRAGMRFESMCLSGHRKYPLGSEDTATRDTSARIMEKAIILARDLGIRIIQIAGYDVYYKPSNDRTRAFFAKNLVRAVDSAAKYGVMLAFETMETDFLNTVEKAMYWVKRISSPYLAVYPDSGNITNAALAAGHGINGVLADIESGRGHTAAFHMKESRPGIYREVPYGDGYVDFKSVADKAIEIGVKRFVTEFWYTGQPEWEWGLARAKEFFCAVFS